jgi:hypothetical protein
MTTPKEAADKSAAALHQWPDFTTSESEAVPHNLDDDYQHDREALRRWYKAAMGMAPRMKTTIGYEARQLLLDQIASDLAAVSCKSHD